MDNFECIIVVPTHKEKLSLTEFISFSRLCKLIGNLYKICLVIHNEMNISEYINIASKYNIGLFKYIVNKNYFMSLHTYLLLVSQYQFYEAFQQFKYVFIYLLDCYLFKNDIKYWIDKDYDQCECILLIKNSKFDFYNGIGLRKTQVFINAIKNNYEEYVDFVNKVNKNICYIYGLNYDGINDIFEDFMFSNIISRFNLHDCHKFGLGNSYLENEQKYGMPMMIHNLKLTVFNNPGKTNGLDESDEQWIKDKLGDCINNPEEVINKEFV